MYKYDKLPLSDMNDTGSYHQLDGITEIDPGGGADSDGDDDDEPAWRFGLQVLFPFLVAGLGMIGAGLLLDMVQYWDVYVNVSEVFILVPTLLGLTGSVEMTLASRLSTQANLGTMDNKKHQFLMICGNICLTQAQAIVVGFLAALIAVVFGYISHDAGFDINRALLLTASSVFTAWSASLVLGSIMIAVVSLSRICHINPDNVATPIAASLGDLVTLSILSGTATMLWKILEMDIIWVNPLILGILLALAPLFAWYSWKNSYSRDAICAGWSPVIGAMAIDTLGGVVLAFAVKQFSGLASFQSLINGVGGNLAAVQASRLSTALHKQTKPGEMPKDQNAKCVNPFTVFCGKGTDARTARVLLLLVVPGHLVFLYTVSFIEHVLPPALFVALFLAAALLQVLVLLYLAHWLMRFFWWRGCDPDNFAIPYLTALGDLLGISLLTGVFYVLSITPYGYKGEELNSLNTTLTPMTTMSHDL